MRKIKVKLADSKERTIQHMMQTSFWSPDGKPMSATEFIEQLFGDLPDFFKNENELRELWSAPDTRCKLLEGLREKGYGKPQLSDLAEMVNAENSDLYDVLAYIAYTSPPLSRQERVAVHQDRISSICRGQQREFLRFVLDQYIKEGGGKLCATGCDLMQRCATKRVKGLEPSTYQLGKLTLHDTNLDKTTLYKTASASTTSRPTSSTVTNRDLRRLIDAWPTLSEPVKAGILAMVEVITTEEPEPKGS